MLLVDDHRLNDPLVEVKLEADCELDDLAGATEEKVVPPTALAIVTKTWPSLDSCTIPWRTAMPA